MASPFPHTLPVLDPAALRARVTRRSYWRLRFTDGRIVGEWEVDWSEVPTKGRQAIRLYCPNGQVAELGNTQDATDRIFQFKRGMLMAGVGRGATYQVIGILEDTDGNCTCAAWDYAHQQLLTFSDNVHHMAFDQTGRLEPDVLGIRP
jgi:hypothetical protein